jgi:hypothetical protein
MDGYAGGYGGMPGTMFQAPKFSDRWGSEEIGHEKVWSLWRYYEPVVEFVQTVIISGGVAIPTATEGARTLTAAEIAGADAGSGEGGKAVFRGRLTHPVTAGEATILTTAGYTVT